MELKEFAETLDAFKMKQDDKKVPAKDLHFHSGQFERDISPDSLTGIVSELTPLANRQLAERLGIPIKYWNRMKEEDLPLLDVNVNAWLQKETSSFFLRELVNGHRTTRAVLSDSYRVIDNPDVFYCTLDETAGKDMQVENLVLDDAHMTIQFKSKDLVRDVRPGDTVVGGISIRNSEVGLGSVLVTPRIFRVVCTNGLVLEQFKLRQVHLGKGDGGEFENSMVYNNIRMSIRNVFASFGEIVNLMKDSTDMKFDASKISKVIQNVVDKFILTESQRDRLLMAWGAEPEPTVYGLCNAITRAAKDESEFENRYSLETIAGEVMTTPADKLYASLLAA